MAGEFHLAFCGHAKHGKSTLVGRLAFEFKAITEPELSRLAELARQKGKDFNMYSMALLASRPATQQRGTGLPDDSSRSVFPARAAITVDDTRLTLIDTPGYSRFLDNIIYGLYLADAAVVVVEATAGVAYGTKTVNRILQAFRVPVVAYCITKMGVVGYAEARYQEVCQQIRAELYGADAGSAHPAVIPVSALEGPELGKSYRDGPMGWYPGPRLTDIVDQARSRVEAQTGSRTRLAVEGPKEVFSPKGVGTILVGTLEAGVLHRNDEIMAEPASALLGAPVKAIVKSLRQARSVTEGPTRDLDEVGARAIVAVNVSGWSRAEAEGYFRHGGVLGPVDDPPTVARLIRAEVMFFEAGCVYAGKEYRVDPHVSGVTARFRTIISRNRLECDLETDEFTTTGGESVEAIIEFTAPFCIETHSSLARLSRFVIRESNRVVGCGRCTEILRSEIDAAAAEPRRDWIPAPDSAPA